MRKAISYPSTGISIANITHQTRFCPHPYSYPPPLQPPPILPSAPIHQTPTPTIPNPPTASNPQTLTRIINTTRFRIGKRKFEHREIDKGGPCEGLGIREYETCQWAFWEEIGSDRIFAWQSLRLFV